MTWARGSRNLWFAVLLSLSALAQKPAEHFHPPAQSNQPKNPKPANQNGQTPQPKMGEWLNQHKSLPPDQQEKLLENDPGFKRLPPQRQAELRERLRKFNNLPPAQRERALNRMQWIASLTPEQRQQIRDANTQLQGLPQERQVKVHTALRHLRQMDPQERQQVFESDRFKTTFSDQERGILTRLSAIGPQEGGAPSPPGQQPPK